MKSTLVFKDTSQNRARALKEKSITEGPILKALLAFFFPILFGTFFQQLYNTIDAVIVGRFVGKQALAAVGGGTAVYVNLLVGFFVGLTSGAGVLISQFYGAKNKMEISRSVHTAIALCIAGGIIISAFGVLCTPSILTIIKTPEDTFEDSLIYLKTYFFGMVPMFLYNMGSSILRSTGDSVTPLIILVIGCISNIVLDIIFVVALELGVLGVALATDLCQLESAVIILAILAKTKESYRFSIKKLRITPHILREILRIGLPAAIQSCMYTISNLIIQTNINSFGTNDVAAWAAYGKIDAIFWMMISAFGISVTTFSGQNYGAKKYGRIKKALMSTLLMSGILTIVSCIIFYIFGGYVFLLFTDDKEVLKEGIVMLHFLVPFWITYISIEILSGTIRGTGSTFIPTIIMIFGICLLRILWLFVAVPKNNTIEMVLTSYPITWTTTSIALWIYYLSGLWLKKRDI